jgi:hypothetical protein
MLPFYNMKTAFVWLLIIFIVNLPGLYYSWYIKWAWFDIVLHFSGGFFMAMFMAGYLKDRLIAGEFIKNALIIIGSTLFMGVIWEFSEYIANQALIEPTKKYLGVTAYFMGDLNDTILDILLDILGAASFAVLHFFRGRKTHEIETGAENNQNPAA